MTRNANAISLKLAQLVVLVTTPLIGSASRQPMMPPMKAITADSARKLASTLRGWKPEREQHGDLRRPRAHRRVHRVHCTEHGADGHDRRDHDREEPENVTEQLRLARVEFGLAVRVHLDALVGEERALRIVEAARVLEPERDVLEGVSAEDTLKLLVLSQISDSKLEPFAVKRQTTFQLRLENRSTSPTFTLAKRPASLAPTQISLCPEAKRRPCDDLDVATYLECLVRHAARDDVSHGERVAARARDVDDDVRLRTDRAAAHLRRWRCAATPR